MATLTVTPAQAQHIARLSDALRIVQQQYAEAVALLALGHAVGALTHINIEDGTLTFEDVA